MSVKRMGEIAASHSAADGTSLFKSDTGEGEPSPPTAQQLLETIGAYIPTDVTTAYVPIAAGMTAAEASKDTRLWVAIVAALLAAFITWRITHRAAAEAATDAKPGPLESLKLGWYEIPAAGIALFVWATAMPGSWVDWADSVLYLPALVVLVASAVIGGLAELLNRPNRD